MTVRQATLALAVWLGLATVLAAAAPAAPNPFRKGPYKKGQIVTVTGQVIDAQDQPIRGVTVIFGVSREAFQLSKMRREEGAVLRTPVEVDDNGRFRIDWRWDPYYNRFALAVAVPVSGGDYEFFHEIEVTGNVLQSNPSDVGLKVPDSAPLRELLAFLKSLDSEDEKRVFEEMGRPDRIDTAQAHYDPDHTWWYFEAGKVYRFKDGTLEQVAQFEPVPDEGGS